MASRQEAVDIPRPQKRVTFGLIVLAIFMPWLALYLDGASWQTIGLNFAAWILLPIPGTAAAIMHAIICLLRSEEHRKYSKPARRRLRYNNTYSANTQVDAEKKSVDPEPDAAPAPVQRAVTEPAPSPVERAPTQPPAAKSSATSSATSVTEPPPAPIKKAPTGPPATKSATSSSTSVSSNVEKEEPPAADGPPPRTATAKEDDLVKGPDA